MDSGCGRCNARNPNPESSALSSGRRFAHFPRVSKRYVYVLKNSDSPPRYYTGLTSNLARRLAEHNADGPHRTCRHRPWSIDIVIEFPDEQRAVAFEQYLKSGSGVAFAHRHLR